MSSGCVRCAPVAPLVNGAFVVEVATAGVSTAREKECLRGRAPKNNPQEGGVGDVFDYHIISFRSLLCKLVLPTFPSIPLSYRALILSVVEVALNERI